MVPKLLKRTTPPGCISRLPGAPVLFVEKVFAANLLEGGKAWGLTRHDFFRCYPLRRLSGLWSRGVTRWVRCSLSVADPFVCRCLNSWTILPSSHPAHRTGQACFRHPALGERSRCCPRDIARPLGKADKAQHFVQGCLRKPPGPRPQHFVLGTQPLTQPLAGVTVHRPIGLADWP